MSRFHCLMVHLQHLARRVPFVLMTIFRSDIIIVVGGVIVVGVVIIVFRKF